MCCVESAAGTGAALGAGCGAADDGEGAEEVLGVEEREAEDRPGPHQQTPPQGHGGVAQGVGH